MKFINRLYELLINSNKESYDNAFFVSLTNLLILIGGTLTAIISIFVKENHIVWIALASIIISFISTFLNKRNKTDEAAYLSLSTVILLVVIVAIIDDGLNDISVVLFPGVLLLTAIHFNGQKFWFFTIFIIITLPLIVLTRLFLGTESIPTHVEFGDIILLTVFILLEAVMINAVINNLKNKIKILLMSDEKNKAFYENFSNIFIQVDITGKIIDVSPSIEEVTKQNRETFINTFFDLTFQSSVRFFKILESLKQNKRLSDIIVRFKNKNENIRMIGSFELKKDLDNNSYIFATLSNISNSNSTINEATNVEQNNEYKEVLTKYIHELNNVFSGIYGYSQVLEIGHIKDDKGKKYLEALLSSAKKGSQVVNNINKQLLEGSYKHSSIPYNNILIDKETDDEFQLNLTDNNSNIFIMLVDDEEHIVRTTKEILNNYSFEVDAFKDPLVAYENFSSNYKKYNLIITDMNMPQMSGYSLIEKIRIINNKVPIVVMTGFNNLLDQEKTVELQINKVLNKPILADELVHSINHILKR